LSHRSSGHRPGASSATRRSGQRRGAPVSEEALLSGRRRSGQRTGAPVIERAVPSSTWAFRSARRRFRRRRGAPVAAHAVRSARRRSGQRAAAPVRAGASIIEPAPGSGAAFGEHLPHGHGPRPRGRSRPVLERHSSSTSRCRRTQHRGARALRR
jgi:hypothetical protein